MPAASESPGAASPRATFRPRGVRLAAILFGVLLFGVSAVIWFAFPQETRDLFTLPQRATLVGFGLAAALVGYAMGRSRIDVREDGLLVVNGFRSHFYPYQTINRVTLRAGGPWAIVELTDGEAAAAMGIQGSDGDRAVAQIKELRSVMREYTGR